MMSSKSFLSRVRLPRLLSAGLLLGAAVVAASLVLAVPGRAVQAQGVMSAPACQCSAPTQIVGIGARVAHCLCGAMSCAIAEAGEGAAATTPRGAPMMQCVRS